MPFGGLGALSEITKIEILEETIFQKLRKLL